VEQRKLDQLVRTITRELAAEQSHDGTPRTETSSGAAQGPDGGFFLIDNWRVRIEERASFLSFYTRHVAEVVKQLPGYVDGRVLAAPFESAYSWHVQALYEFGSDAILDNFHRDFDRQVRRVDSTLSLEKVLDAMDRWVLAHEDGTLTEVWPTMRTIETTDSRDQSKLTSLRPD
jgi:hypothetical protein